MGRNRSLRLVVFFITQRLERRKYDYIIKKEYTNQNKTRFQNRRIYQKRSCAILYAKALRNSEIYGITCYA